MQSMTKKKWGDQRGMAAIEFALVLPILIILVFGIIEFSTILYDKAMITNASREGARVGIVYRDDPASALNHPGDTEIENTVNNYIQDHLISLGAASSAAITIDRGEDASGNPLDASGDPLTVTVTYAYHFLVLPNFITDLTGPINLSAVTIMRME